MVLRALTFAVCLAGTAAAQTMVPTGSGIVSTIGSGSTAFCNPSSLCPIYGPDIVNDPGLTLSLKQFRDLLTFGEQPNTARPLAFRLTTGGYFVYTYVGHNFAWLEDKLANLGTFSGGQQIPFRWTSMIVQPFRDFVLPHRGLVQNGSWTNVDSHDVQYVGHRSLQSNVLGDYIEATITGPADITFLYTGRTAAGTVAFSVDGVDNGITVNTTSAIDLTNHLSVTAATLTSGSHTVRARLTTAFRVLTAGFGIVGPSYGFPATGTAYPRAWQPTFQYFDLDEVVGPDGTIYDASNTNVSGTNPPVCHSGSCSDGGVTWIALASSSFVPPYNTPIQLAGSALEYAYEVLPTGETVVNDVGGEIHGNEYVTGAPTVRINGTMIDPVPYQFYTGTSVSIEQLVTAFYDPINTPIPTAITSDFVAQTTLTHSWTAEKHQVDHTTTWYQPAAIGWWYPAMLRVLPYYGPGVRKIMDTMVTPRGGTFTLATYSGSGDTTILGVTRDYSGVATGRAFHSQGTVTAGPVCTPEVVDTSLYDLKTGFFSYPIGPNAYRAPGNYGMLGVVPNQNAGAYTGCGSWSSKFYSTRTEDIQRLQVAAGEVWSARAFYATRLGP